MSRVVGPRTKRSAGAAAKFTSACGVCWGACYLDVVCGISIGMASGMSDITAAGHVVFERDLLSTPRMTPSAIRLARLSRGRRRNCTLLSLLMGVEKRRRTWPKSCGTYELDVDRRC